MMESERVRSAGFLCQYRKGNIHDFILAKSSFNIIKSSSDIPKEALSVGSF